ncbi:unnamed protein product [Periconia digitata]|uniref:Uncharacterized protein n=1 Tax=Periconia digitata TaxID=1303443 RepID=A0A9W4URE3_9PLEO|nr:unnamed protein product [Periconia digitata]
MSPHYGSYRSRYGGPRRPHYSKRQRDLIRQGINPLVQPPPQQRNNLNPNPVSTPTTSAQNIQNANGSSAQDTANGADRDEHGNGTHTPARRSCTRNERYPARSRRNVVEEDEEEEESKDHITPNPRRSGANRAQSKSLNARSRHTVVPNSESDPSLSKLF